MHVPFDKSSIVCKSDLRTTIVHNWTLVDGPNERGYRAGMTKVQDIVLTKGMFYKFK